MFVPFIPHTLPEWICFIGIHSPQQPLWLLRSSNSSPFLFFISSPSFISLIFISLPFLSPSSSCFYFPLFPLFSVFSPSPVRGDNLRIIFLYITLKILSLQVTQSNLVLFPSLPFPLSSRSFVVSPMMMVYCQTLHVWFSATWCDPSFLHPTRSDLFSSAGGKALPSSHLPLTPFGAQLLPVRQDLLPDWWALPRHTLHQMVQGGATDHVRLQSVGAISSGLITLPFPSPPLNTRPPPAPVERAPSLTAEVSTGLLEGVTAAIVTVADNGH